MIRKSLKFENRGIYRNMNVYKDDSNCILLISADLSIHNCPSLITLTLFFAETLICVINIILFFPSPLFPYLLSLTFSLPFLFPLPLPPSPLYYHRRKGRGRSTITGMSITLYGWRAGSA